MKVLMNESQVWRVLLAVTTTLLIMGTMTACTGQEAAKSTAPGDDAPMPLRLDLKGDTTFKELKVPRISEMNPAAGPGPGSILVTANGDLKLLSPAGKVAVTGSYDARDHGPRPVALSVSGDALLYMVSKKQGRLEDSLTALRLADFKTGEDRLLFRNPKGTYIGETKWSPDGKSIFFHLVTFPEGPRSLWRVQRDGKGLSQVIAYPADKELRGYSDAWLMALNPNGKQALVSVDNHRQAAPQNSIQALLSVDLTREVAPAGDRFVGSGAGAGQAETIHPAVNFAPIAKEIPPAQAVYGFGQFAFLFQDNGWGSKGDVHIGLADASGQLTLVIGDKAKELEIQIHGFADGGSKLLVSIYDQGNDPRGPERQATSLYVYDLTKTDRPKRLLARNSNNGGYSLIKLEKSGREALFVEEADGAKENDRSRIIAIDLRSGAVRAVATGVGSAIGTQ